MLTTLDYSAVDHIISNKLPVDHIVMVSPAFIIAKNLNRTSIYLGKESEIFFVILKVFHKRVIK